MSSSGKSSVQGTPQLWHWLLGGCCIGMCIGGIYYAAVAVPSMDTCTGLETSDADARDAYQTILDARQNIIDQREATIKEATDAKDEAEANVKSITDRIAEFDKQISETTAARDAAINETDRQNYNNRLISLNVQKDDLNSTLPDAQQAVTAAQTALENLLESLTPVPAPPPAPEDQYPTKACLPPDVSAIMYFSGFLCTFMTVFVCLPLIFIIQKQKGGKGGNVLFVIILLLVILVASLTAKIGYSAGDTGCRCLKKDTPEQVWLAISSILGPGMLVAVIALGIGIWRHAEQGEELTTLFPASEWRAARRHRRDVTGYGRITEAGDAEAAAAAAEAQYTEEYPEYEYSDMPAMGEMPSESVSAAHLAGLAPYSSPRVVRVRARK